MRRTCARSGFTLVELLVVMAIIAILGVLAYPAFLSMLPSEDLSAASRDLYTKLQSARAYAATHRVNTALVYSLDNYVSPAEDPDNDDPLPEPILASGSQQFVRVITSVAIMRELPPSAGAYAGKFVPIDGAEGVFETLPGDAVLLLNDPGPPYEVYYVNDRPRVAPPEDSNDVQQVYRLGMSIVDAYVEGTGPDGPDTDPAKSVSFLAHVFKPSGALDARGNAPEPPERVTLHVSLYPTAPVEERYVNPDALSEVRSVPLQLYKSTGRSRIVPALSANEQI